MLQEGVGSVAPKLKELDLSGNFLSSFASILTLTEELKSLSHLNLSCNRLSFCPGAGGCQLLQVLILNSTRVSWVNVRSDVLTACF